MKIECSKCKSIPKIDILDEIQAIRFECQNNNNNSHYGIFSINNFYKYFISNYKDELITFINSLNMNVNDKKNNNHNSSIYEFIKFQNDFDNLLKELNTEYQKLKNYFYKILFIKDRFEIEKNNKNNEIGNYYYNSHIIKGIKDLIETIKNTILIKEDYPKIKNDNEINNKINNELISINNKHIFNFNDINKDFEYFNIRHNNISVKKLYKFELNNDEIDIIRDRKLLLLNTSKDQVHFIYSYTKREKNKCSSYINIYDNNLNLLFSKLVCNKRIHEIILLKDNSLLLILYQKILILIIDINKKIFTILQELEKKTKFYFETLLDNKKISLLIPINTKKHFYLKNNTNENSIYLSHNILINLPVSNDNSHFIDNNNFINLNDRKIFFYNINCNYNNEQNSYNIEIINNKIILIKEYINYGIHFINNDIFVISGMYNLFLISFKYKEIISKFSYYNIDRIYNGFTNECYLGLNAWVSKHKIIRQINFNENIENKNKEKGEMIVEGHAYLEEFDFYNKYSLIDLGNIICYIKVNKEEDEMKFIIE